MAGVAAGVVTEADVSSQPSNGGGGSGLSLQDPATWSYIWVALSILYLFGVYMGMIRIIRRGA